MISLDRLSADDVQILKREGGAVRGHTCKVLVLERSGGRPLPSLQALREHVGARLDAAPRLRKRLVTTPLRVANPVWLDDPEFDIARHIRRVQTNGPVPRSELEPIVARLMTERLERAHPLWCLDVVEPLEDDSMALIWRIHHCLADGTTGVRLCSAVLWSADAELLSSPSASWSPQAAPGSWGLFARGLLDRAHRAPRESRPRGQRAHLRTSRIVVKRELRPVAAVTPLAHRAGSGRAVAFAAASLERCRQAGKAIDDAITLNDVVLAIMAGGMRTWLDRGPGPVPGISGIRVKVPVSLHHDGEGDAASNRDSYFFVDLPVAETDPAQRVLAINRETTKRKLNHDAETLYRLGAHPFLSHWAMSPRVFTFNVSNVRGPAGDVYVLGARVRELYSLAEIAQRHALRVSVISATGSLFFGLCADRDAVKDLDVLADGLRRSTEELLRLID
jgi:diacylglycerol O-acyltransferase / wax synthase